LETVLTGRNLLSPMLAQASRDVTAFNTQMAGANAKASTSAVAAAGVQDSASARVVAANTRASTSATVSATTQARAHTQAAESASLSARVQESANRSLAASNGLLGTSLTPLTAGIGATGLALAYAGYRGMEFDSAMSQVQAASQATAGDMGKLRDAAVDAGADTQYSAVEAAQGITEMSKAGVSAKDILGGGLTGALNLAAAGQMEVADAAEVGATALSVFNLEGDQMSHVADLLAAGAGKAQGSVHDLGMALNQSALVANQTGLSVEDTAGALAMFASNGLVGSDAGTSFKTMLQALTPNSNAAAKAMDAIGFSAYDAQGKFVGMESVAGQLRTGLAGLTEEQRNTTLETIFGSDAVRAASVLYKEGAAGIEEWTGKVNDAGYAQRQAAQLTDNLRGDLERLGGAVDSFFTSLGSGAQGPLRELVQGFTAVVSAGGDVVGFLSALPGPAKATLAALVAIHLANGPLSGTLAAVGGHLSNITTRAGGAAASLMTLRGAGAGVMAAFGGPWGVAIAAVGGLATALELANPPIEITEANVGKLNTALERFGRTGDMSGELSRMFGDLDGVVADLNAAEPAISGFVDNLLYGLEVINAQGQIDLGQWLTVDGDAYAEFDRMQAEFQQAQQDVEDLDSTLSGMVTGGQAEAAAKATMRLYDAWVKSGGEIGEFRRKFPEAVGAMEAYALTSQTVVTDTGQITNGMGEAKSAADLLKDAIDALNGVALSNVEANIAWTETLLGIKIAAEDGSNSLELNTLAGAANAQQFTDAARKAADFAATVADTEGIEAGRVKIGELRQALLDQAESAGFDIGVVGGLIDTILRVPEDTPTAINLADNATPGIDAVNAALDYTDGRAATVYVKTVTTEVVNRILNAVPYNEVGSGGNPIGLPPVPGRASGGPVWPGQTFLVGEEGPELVRFNTVGAVIPAAATANMLSSRPDQSAAAVGYSPPVYNAAGTGFSAAPASMAGYAAPPPAAMPGYGSAGGWGGAAIDYDRLAAALDRNGSRKTTHISVDATGLNADVIASKVAQRQREEEFLSAP
jgi:TP901 family phage tail tape measure protein